MKKLFLLFGLLFHFANAFAFDWNKLATPVKVDGIEIKVTSNKFDKRYYAMEFCKKIDMKLASFETLKKAAQIAADQPKVKDVIFSAHYNSGKVTGVWGWSDEEGKMKVDDTNVTLQFDGSGESPIPTSLTIINNDMIKNGLLPYKGLPAFCEPL